MINSENANKETMLMELSIKATDQGIFSHLKIKTNSAKAIVQPMPNMTLNLVCDNGDEAMGIMNDERGTLNLEVRDPPHHSIFLVQYSSR